PLLAIVGHIDEIGISITYVGDDGLLAFSVLGGHDPEQMAGQRVLIAGRSGILTGVVGRRMLSRDERRDRQPLKHTDLHIDIGARTAAFALDPQVAIAIDVTWSTEVPGGNPKRVGKIEVGAGAAVTVGPVVSPVVSDLLRETAEAEGIGHCIEVYSDRTQTDA